MDLERKINIFGVLAIFLFGSVFGGVVVYQHIDERITELEDSLEGSQVAGEAYTGGLEEIFQEVEDSVVSVRSAGEEQAEGSGFVYSEDGYIVTNHHVVRELDSIEVVFTDGETVNAELAGQDVYSDLAVLEVERSDLEEVTIADSEDVEVGETAIALGNPFGFQGTITAGIISQKERLIPTQTDFSIPDVVQTDAAINPGNSGGPLMNHRGEVIGVNTAIETGTGTFAGIGLAVSSNTVEQVVPELIDEGYYRHSWIGVAGQAVNEDIADEMDLDNPRGFMVVEVVDDGPAEDAGIREGDRTMDLRGYEVPVGGDVIVEIEDEEIRDISDILLYLQRNTEPGDTVEVTIVREGEEREVDITLGSRPVPGE